MILKQLSISKNKRDSVPRHHSSRTIASWDPLYDKDSDLSCDTNKSDEKRKEKGLYPKKDVTNEKTNEAKKKRGKNNRLSPFSTVSRLFFTLILVFSFVSIATSSPVSTSLSPFTEKAHTIARFVNGLSLGQTSSLDKKALTNELFPIGPTLTLDDLGSLNTTQLANDVGSIHKAIGSQCSGNDGCAVSEKVLDGMKTVKALEAHVKTVQSSLDVFRSDGFQDITQLSKTLKYLKSWRSSNVTSEVLNELKKLTSNITTKEEMDEVSTKIIDEYENLVRIKGKWNSTLSTNLEANLNIARVVIEPMTSIETEIQSLHPQTDAISTIKNEIASTESRFRDLSGALNNNTLKTVSTSVIRLLALNPFAHQQRNLTASFLDGFKDLKLATEDDTSSWFTEFLDYGNQYMAISPNLAILEELIKRLGSFNSSYELFKAQLDVQFWSFLDKLTEASQSISQHSGLVSEVSECVQNLDLSIEYTGNVSDLLTKLSLSAENEVTLNQTNVFFNQSAGLFEKTDELVKKVQEVLLGTAADDYSLIKDPLLNDTIQALEKFDYDLKSLDLDSLESWLSQINSRNLKAGFQDWNKGTGFLISMKCLKDGDYIGKIPSLNSSLKSITGLEKDLKSTTKLAESIGNMTAEWIKLNPLLSTKPKSFTNSGLYLNNSEKIAKEFGDIASIIYKFDKMERKEKDLMVILQGKQAISESIDLLRDPEVKENLKKMWTEKNIKAFESNLKTSKSLMKEVKNKEIEEMIDFKDPFEKAANVSACGIDLRQLAVMLRGRIKDTKVATSLESLKSVDVSFVSYKKTDFDSMLTELEEYLNSLIFMNDCYPGADCPSEGGIPPWFISPIIAGAISIVGVGMMGVAFCFDYCCIQKIFRASEQEGRVAPKSNANTKKEKLKTKPKQPKTGGSMIPVTQKGK
uniref:WSN domain-containing protein n=1 Tax=Caenorhabditis tropicalis TaxID=1561998 RepID=A0A1I7UP80_9PELO